MVIQTKGDGLRSLDELNDPEIYRLYQSIQRSYFDVVSILPLVTMCYVAALTRFNFQYVGTSGPLFSTAFSFFLLGSLLLIPHLVARVAVTYTPKERQVGTFFRICDSWLLWSYRANIEDTVVVIGTLIVGFYLLARVWAGQCDSLSNVWESQRCNPYASVKSIPGDQVILLYLVPLMAQSIIRGVSIRALIISWALNIIFVIIATMHVGGYLDLWTIMYSVIFINISYVLERLMRITFVQSRATVIAVELSSKIALDLLELRSENERKLKEKEIFQLRGLMGNVAHDLKTPLHSIEADLEVLCVFISKIPTDAINFASVLIQTENSGGKFETEPIFHSLSANCKFMCMAINRSQDFMKASNNIALVPVMETFDIISALTMSVNCINHLQSSRSINVLPICREICPYMISDKYWLSENALCLLSNAIKYSDTGVIDVCVKLIDDLVTKYETDPSDEEIKDSQKSHKIDVRSLEESDFCNSPLHPSRRMIMLSVEDSGIGITEEARKHLFQPFKQAQRMAGGTGLGLYSLSKRIEALGGSNGVSDRSDGKQGSMFWFTFPYRPDETARVDVKNEGVLAVEHIHPDVQDITPRIILLIDDALSILKVTTRLLMMNGHSVKTASNGSIGLKMLKEAYRSQEYNMVLTDLQMPVMDGIEATRRYREFEEEELDNQSRLTGCDTGARKKLLIVGMSANSDDQSRQVALDSGMDYFLSKPFSYKELRAILEIAGST